MASDRFTESEVHGFLALVVMLFSMGATIGLGHLLASSEVITVRKALGRAIVAGGLGLMGGLLVLVPLLKGSDKTFVLVAVFGAGAFLASLGTSGVERLFALVAPHVEGKLKRWSRK